MKKEQCVVVLGSVNIDLVTKVPKIPREDDVVISEGLKVAPGGKATNAVIGIARLGLQTYMVGKTGQDSFGDEAQRVFDQEGVSTEYVDVDPFTPTGTVMVNVDAKGKNTIIVNEDANIRINKNAIADLFQKVDRGELRIDCFYFTLEPLPEIVEFAISEANKRNILLFCDAAPQARPLKSWLYRNLHFLSANEFEATAMTGFSINDVDSAKKATHILREQGARNIIITLGRLGAVLLAENQRNPVYFPGKKVNVVDETAAGDAFRAAFVAEYVTRKNLSRAMEFANIAGAYAVTRLGAYEAMPTKDDLKFLETFD